MKHFTRLILSLGLLLPGSYGMAQFDLQVNSIATVSTSGGQVPPGIPITLAIEVENDGADWPAGTQVGVAALLSGDTLGVLIWTFNVVFPAGSTYVLETGTFELPAAPPSISLCGIAVLGLPEGDTLNNISCSPYTVSSAANVDLAAMLVFPTVPTLEDLDSFDIDGGEETPDNITELNAIYKNDGNTTFPAGYRVAYRIYFDGDESDVIMGTLAEDLPPGDSTTRVVTVAYDVPAEVGYYELCAVLAAGDSDEDNDTTCTGFTIIDTYIPPPPIGIADVDAEGLNVYYSEGQVWVKNVASNTNVMITDMQGRVVEQVNLLEDANISMSGATPGVYMIQSTVQASGAVKMSKFVVN